MSKTIVFQTIQFSISAHFSSIWLIVRALSDTTTPRHSGPEGDGYEGVLCIPQSSSSITGTSPSDCLMYIRTLIGGRVLTPIQMSSWYILLPQSAGQLCQVVLGITYLYSKMSYYLCSLTRTQQVVKVVP